MNFLSGGVVEGTMSGTTTGGSSSAPAASSIPPRPPAVPSHYVFDAMKGAWLPPTASSTESRSAGVEVQKMFSLDDPNEPICYDYVNTGTCLRMMRGGKCKHRHLEAMHPAVVEDRVRSGKLPRAALEAVRAGDTETLVQLMRDAVEQRLISSTGLPSRPTAPLKSTASIYTATGDLMDPGPEYQFCFDYTTKGVCKRLNNGITCRARHLPRDHPEVIEYLKKPIPASTSGLRFKTKEEKVGAHPRIQISQMRPCVPRPALARRTHEKLCWSDSHAR